MNDVVFELPGNARMRALRAPREGAPQIVLLHGAGGNADTFRPCLFAWDWADVWCFDLPGRGGSTGPPLESVRTLAQWLRICIEAAEIEPIVVGHSLGGGIGLELALSSPSTIRGLVMVSSGARLRVSPQILETARRATAPLRLDFAFADRSLADAYHQRADRTPLPAMVADWEACDGFDVRERLDGLSVPLGLLWGSADALTPTKFQHWLGERTGAEAQMLDGHGHMLPWEAPREVARAVRAWVASWTQTGL